MSVDQKREHVVSAIRAAITRWIESDGREGSRALRDGLHALSACRAMEMNVRDKP
jgi:hypothetical protein